MISICLGFYLNILYSAQSISGSEDSFLYITYLRGQGHNNISEKPCFFLFI